MPTPSATHDTHEWRQRASHHQVALMALAKERLQLNILHIVTSQAATPVKRVTEHIQTVGEPRGRRVAVPQPVKPGKFLIHSNLKLVKEPQRTPKTQVSTVAPQRQLYLTGIPILTAVAPQEADRRAIVVKSLPRGVHALQVRNTDATYLIPVSCPDMTLPLVRTPSVVVARPKPDPALQEQLMEFDKVCKEVKERSAPAKKKPPTKEITRTDEEHKHAKIYAILAEYHKKLANSPDLNNKPAPRRRSAPPAGGAVVAKRKKVPVQDVKRPPRDTPATATSAGQLVNYVSIVRPLRIALGGQRLVALPSSTLTQSHQTTARPKVLVLDKPSGQYVIKQLSTAPAAPKVESTAPHLPDCEDLGVEVPNASDLFPEADYLLEECLAPSDFGAEEVIDTPPATVIRSVQ